MHLKPPQKIFMPKKYPSDINREQFKKEEMGGNVGVASHVYTFAFSIVGAFCCPDYIKAKTRHMRIYPTLAHDCLRLFFVFCLYKS